MTFYVNSQFFEVVDKITFYCVYVYMYFSTAIVGEQFGRPALFFSDGR